ncbi:MAG: glycerophosphodiester phosphodiesterase family protein [Neisseriaceae bacterium]
MTLKQASLVDWNYPKWFAHRGGGRVAPENTLKGFQAAYENGLKGIEFDVKLSQDNQAVVFHDEDLWRVAHLKEKVVDLSSEKLLATDAAVNFPEYQPAYVPSFEQAAKFCLDHQMAANIELKPNLQQGHLTAQVVVKQALDYWGKETPPPLFSSFCLNTLAYLRDFYPSTRRGLLIEEWLPTDEELIQRLEALGCVALHAPEEGLTEGRIRQVRRAGFKVLVWTVNDLERAKELLDWGVDGIITDLIDQVAGLV